MGLDPSPIFYRELSDRLGFSPKFGNDQLQLPRIHFELFLAFDAFLFIRPVFQVLFDFKLLMQEPPKVVGKHQETGVGLFGTFSFGPRFALVKFIFEDVKALLDPPAQKVKLGDDSGWDVGWQVGEKDKFLAGVRTGESDAPQHVSSTRGSLFVGGHACVDGVISFEGEGAAFDEGGVGLLTTQEVDPAPLFPTLPGSVVESGTVPDVEHFLSFGGPLPKGVDFQSLETAHVMGFDFCLIFPRQAEVVDQAGSQVERIEVGDRFFPSLVVTGVMGAGGVKVTVASLEMKVFEGLMKTGGGVFAKCF